MFKKILVVFFALGALVSTDVVAGPFGLEKGMQLKDIGGEYKPLARGMYRFADVPKSHSAFEYYVVQVTPKQGLCWVKAIGNDISTNSYGTMLETEHDKVRGKLEKVYGSYKSYDFLMPDSIWDEPGDWMMGILKKDRHLATSWDREHGSTLPVDVREIMLTTHALSNDSGYITLEYAFSNEKACAEEMSAKEDGAF